MVAIVATGRYPRALFDFNVGVLRWTLARRLLRLLRARRPTATRRSRSRATDYPAELEIAYPERLSRWKAVLKPWLLAHPALRDARRAARAGWRRTRRPVCSACSSLIAAVLLLVRGRYPRDIFSLVVGINRWALRVAAYAGLMRDEYPPFRLDR